MGLKAGPGLRVPRQSSTLAAASLPHTSSMPSHRCQWMVQCPAPTASPGGRNGAPEADRCLISRSITECAILPSLNFVDRGNLKGIIRFYELFNQLFLFCIASVCRPPSKQRNHPSVGIAKKVQQAQVTASAQTGPRYLLDQRCYSKRAITGEGIAPTAPQGWARMAVDTAASFHPRSGHLSSSHCTLPLSSTQRARVQEKQGDEAVRAQPAPGRQELPGCEVPAQPGTTPRALHVSSHLLQWPAGTPPWWRTPGPLVGRRTAMK